jgi:Proto-chlorophyllide reductase 57 kD subunit
MSAPSDCPADDLRSAPEAGPGEVTWTPEAEARLQRAPAFLRGMVRRLAERRARAEGISAITPDVMTRYKEEMMGLAARGEYAVRVPFTPDAAALLDAVPEFMRPITRRICEELAIEQGAPEVTPALIHEAEGRAGTEAAGEALPWTPEAEGLLLARLGRTPAMMADFVLRMFKCDVEVEARRRGEPVVTAEVFQRAWTVGADDRVEWDEAAWARLQTAPEFVREGIRKAAERRARHLGARVITSPLLTVFRNRAMMKAVRRIRELGFSDLTFDAFDAAKERLRVVSLNPEAQERLDAIRRYFATERQGKPGDTLGEDLMRRFRAYLKDPAAAPLPAGDLVGGGLDGPLGPLSQASGGRRPEGLGPEASRPDGECGGQGAARSGTPQRSGEGPSGVDLAPGNSEGSREP